MKPASDPTLLDACVDGAAADFMTVEELDSLTRYAREVFDQLSRAGRIGDDVLFDPWLDAQVHAACERQTLLMARHEDYNYIRGHLALLAGNTTLYRRANDRMPIEPAVRALEKLRQECDAAADVIERPRHYVVKIAKARFKTTDVKGLTARQLWGLVMDIRRAAQRKRKRMNETVRPGQLCMIGLN